MSTERQRGRDVPAGVAREQAREAKESLGAALADEPGVCGLGLGRADDGGWVLVVNVTRTEVVSRIPGQVGATPVLTRVTGPVRATGDSSDTGNSGDTTGSSPG